MALTARDQNFISNLISLSDQNIGNGENIDETLGEWFGATVNSLTGVTDGDIAAVFPHLTKAKITAAITAISNLQTALGTGYSGTQRGNLLEMKG
jgi:hypothetical protein